MMMSDMASYSQGEGPPVPVSDPPRLKSLRRSGSPSPIGSFPPHYRSEIVFPGRTLGNITTVLVGSVVWRTLLSKISVMSLNSFLLSVRRPLSPTLSTAQQGKLQIACHFDWRPYQDMFRSRRCVLTMGCRLSDLQMKATPILLASRQIILQGLGG